MMRAYIPSPPISALHLGPLTVHMYALAIIAGILVAIWVGDRRWRARGGYPGEVADVAVWAVPFGIVGGRLYHLVTDPELYFTRGQHPWRAFAIWDGGLGIWGAVALGAVGAGIGCRRHNMRLPPFADAIAQRSLWPRASAGSGTGSTKNSSAHRRHCPGPCTSPTPPTEARLGSINPRSPTSSSGTSPSPHS
jgi:prolipoprotein diacylglyceryltransferase